MFVPDFQVAQGVLAVDAASIAIANMAELPPAGGGFLQKTNQSMPTFSIEVWPGDIPVLKQKPVSASQLFFDGTVGTTQPSYIVIEICPGDVPWPK